MLADSPVGAPPPTITVMTDGTASTDRAIERDSMGEMEVPADALYGASTQRAVLNFPISGQRLPRRFLRALALIKLAAAETNGELGLLDADVAGAIAAAAAEVADGGHDDQFPIDIYQTGSGTSTNTNMNEVVAHLASGAARRRPDGPSERRRQPLPELERHDPDGAPAVGRDGHRGGAAPGARAAPHRARGQGEEFWPVVKTGRTHLQDATPIRLGQEFRGYAGQVEESLRRARAAQAELLDGAARRDRGRDRHQRPSGVRAAAPAAGCRR